MKNLEKVHLLHADTERENCWKTETCLSKDFKESQKPFLGQKDIQRFSKEVSSRDDNSAENGQFNVSIETISKSAIRM